MALGLLLSCKKPSSGTTPDNPFNKYDRSTLLINLSQNIAIPTWKALSQSVDSLSALSNRFNQNPKIEELDSLKIQWNQTQHRLKLAEAMQFYPNTELSTYSNLDFWPVRSTDVESYITNTDTFNATVISTKGTTIKGMPLLGYLLFSQASSQDQLATFTNGNDGLKRRNYLVALTKVLNSDVQFIIKKWTDNASTYQNNTQQDVNGSINLTVNTIIQMIGKVITTGLGLVAIAMMTRYLGAEKFG
jgi:predicted lipoprotein